MCVCVLVHHRLHPLSLAQKEAEFLRRLQTHRYSEVSKYDDDYYGEKVLTLSDYRQWVRQQQKRRRDMQRVQQTELSGR